MKQKDIVLVIAIAAVAGIMSLIASKVIFVSAENRQQEVETVEVISTTFTLPSSAYFNPNAVNPTQIIQIGNSTNPAPFSQGDN